MKKTTIIEALKNSNGYTIHTNDDGIYLYEKNEMHKMISHMKDYRFDNVEISDNNRAHFYINRDKF